MFPNSVHAKTVAASLNELWSPRVIAELEDSYVKVAKIEGEFVWHAHEHEDELFLILDGVLNMQLRDRTVVLHTGDVFVVPKGLEHNPQCDAPCLVMLIEKKTTAHTGDVVTAKTRTLEDQLRPV